jgi:hypothetical protein
MSLMGLMEDSSCGFSLLIADTWTLIDFRCGGSSGNFCDTPFGHGRQISSYHVELNRMLEAMPSADEKKQI